MSPERLRDTFALLLRHNHGETASLSAALSADAARAIRRRVALRLAGRIGAIVAVGSLGTATVVAAYGGVDGDGAIESPIPTPTIGGRCGDLPRDGRARVRFSCGGAEVRGPGANASSV